MAAARSSARGPSSGAGGGFGGGGAGGGRGETLLRPAIALFTAAVEAPAAEVGAAAAVPAMRRAPLIDGLEMCAYALDHFGLGSYMHTNVKKLRKARASEAEQDYGAWLLSELPTHAKTKYKEFVDDSAFMGNLWLCWILDFYVAMCRGLVGGAETRVAINQAYQRTLSTHHNWMQRQLFNASVATKTPARPKFFEALRGSAESPAAVMEDLQAFADVGATVAEGLRRVNEVVCTRMQEERMKYGK